MKTVLVTGVNGFVGHHVIKELVAHGLEVHGIGGQQASRESLPELTSYQVLDLSDAQQAAKIQFSGIDAVLHLAGLANVGASFSEPQHYISSNTGIEINLFEAAMKQKASPRFVIVSSASFYDPAASLPLTETSAILPNSPYAVSKLAQELLAGYYSLRGFDCIIARPFNHIGPGQNLGFIVPDVISQLVNYEQGRASDIAVGNLDAKRDYTDVRDIAHAYRLLLEKGQPGETYNICSGTAYSGHELLALVLKIAGIDPKIREDKSRMRPSDNPVVYGSYSKLAEQTSWKPEIPLETTLADALNDWRGRSSAA